jgi:hypothetical protein
VAAEVISFTVIESKPFLDTTEIKALVMSSRVLLTLGSLSFIIIRKTPLKRIFKTRQLENGITYTTLV